MIVLVIPVIILAVFILGVFVFASALLMENREKNKLTGK